MLFKLVTSVRSTAVLETKGELEDFVLHQPELHNMSSTSELTIIVNLFGIRKCFLQYRVTLY